jgi:hypothetical protein
MREIEITELNLCDDLFCKATKQKKLFFRLLFCIRTFYFGVVLSTLILVKKSLDTVS